MLEAAGSVLVIAVVGSVAGHVSVEAVAKLIHARILAAGSRARPREAHRTTHAARTACAVPRGMSNTPTARCIIGFDYHPAKGKAIRFEPGDTVAGVPAKQLAKWSKHDPALITLADADAKDAA